MNNIKRNKKAETRVALCSQTPRQNAGQTVFWQSFPELSMHEVTWALARIIWILQVWGKAMILHFFAIPMVLRAHLEWQRLRTFCFLTFASGSQLLMLSYCPSGSL